MRERERESERVRETVRETVRIKENETKLEEMKRSFRS